MKTKNGFAIIGVFRNVNRFVISFNNTEYLISYNGSILDELNDSEKNSYDKNLNSTEIKISTSLNASLSDELDEILKEDDPIREKLLNN